MKVLVDISDDQVVAVLQKTIRSAINAAMPSKLPIPYHHMRDLQQAIEYCDAANRVIRHFGGIEVDYASDPSQERVAGKVCGYHDGCPPDGPVCHLCAHLQPGASK